MKVGLTQYVPK